MEREGIPGSIVNGNLEDPVEFKKPAELIVIAAAFFCAGQLFAAEASVRRKQTSRTVEAARSAVAQAETSLKNFVSSFPEAARASIQQRCKGKEAVSYWACAFDSIQKEPLEEPFQKLALRSFQQFLELGKKSQSALEECRKAVANFEANPPVIADEVERHMESKKPKPQCPDPLKVVASWDEVPALTLAQVEAILSPPPPPPAPRPKVAEPARKIVPKTVRAPAPKPTRVAQSKPTPRPTSTRPKIITIDQTEDTDRLLRAWQARQARHFEFARESLLKLEQILSQGKDAKEQTDGTFLFDHDTRARFHQSTEEEAKLARAAYLVDRWLELDVFTAVVAAQNQGADGFWIVHSPGTVAATADDQPSENMNVLDFLIGYPDRRAALDTWGTIGRSKRPVALSAKGAFAEVSAVAVQDAAKAIAISPRLDQAFSEAKEAKLLEELKPLLTETQLQWLSKRIELLRDRVKILSHFTRSS
jgi:hypothetical protein